ESFCVRPNGGRRDRQGTAGLEGRMGDAPDMPELQHHAAATGMDCTGHAFPACDLLGAVDTRRADIALALGRDLGCFRDDESGAGPLGVIQRAQRGGHVAGARTASSKGAMTIRFGSVRGPTSMGVKRSLVVSAGRSCMRQFSFVARMNGTTPPIAVTQPLRVRSNSRSAEKSAQELASRRSRLV